jgi:hypothetical protein
VNILAGDKVWDKVIAYLLLFIDHFADKALVNANRIGQSKLAAMPIHNYFQTLYNCTVRHTAFFAIIIQAAIKVK